MIEVMRSIFIFCSILDSLSCVIYFLVNTFLSLPMRISCKSWQTRTQMNQYSSRFFRFLTDLERENTEANQGIVYARKHHRLFSIEELLIVNSRLIWGNAFCICHSVSCIDTHCVCQHSSSSLTCTSKRERERERERKDSLLFSSLSFALNEK